MSATVKARCVSCGATREIRAAELTSGDVPMCDKCFAPMVAASASTLAKEA